MKTKPIKDKKKAKLKQLKKSSFTHSRTPTPNRFLDALLFFCHHWLIFRNSLQYLNGFCLVIEGNDSNGFQHETAFHILQECMEFVDKNPDPLGRDFGLSVKTTSNLFVTIRRHLGEHKEMINPAAALPILPPEALQRLLEIAE